MAKLPVTVTAVNPMKAGLYTVVVAFSDGTLGSYIVPETLATYDAVRISALVFAMLTDKPPTNLDKPHGKHRRYEPRT
jgi:hypothetical protein